MTKNSFVAEVTFKLKLFWVNSLKKHESNINSEILIFTSFVAAHKGGRNCWVRVQVYGRKLTKSAKFEFLLTRSSHGVFALTNYGYTSQIMELNKLISASQPISTNRCPWIDFIQSKCWFHPGLFCFPIIHHNSIFSSEKPDICVVAS